MKTRQGFVSNSSSSSFIVAAARVVDAKEVEKFFATHSNVYDFDIRRFGVTTNMPTCEQGNQVIVESFNDRCAYLYNMVKGEIYITYSYTGNEGDDSFWNGDECVYDIDEDFFSGSERKIIEFFRTSTALKDYDLRIGAERNG